MCTPKDFTVETSFIANWLIVAVRFAVELNNLCLEPIKNSVFVIFKVSLLAASYTRILSKSRLIQLFISSTSLPAKVMLVSSAYILGWQLGRTFIYNRNRRGPRIVSCGTPQRRNILDDLFPFTKHVWVRLVNKSGTIGLWNPEYHKLNCNFERRMVWSTVSKASVLRSKNTTALIKPRSMFKDQSYQSL